MIGRLIGNYKILEELSRTENFGVYKAVDLLLNRNAVIKVCNQKVSSRTDLAKAFQLEAETLSKLDHQCLPALYSLTAVDDELFMISEYSEGETLDRVLFREGTVSFEKAVLIFAQVFDCVEYTHKNNVAHGSLKTSEIMLTDAGNVKISGYGATETSDKENDIFALALMLYKSLTGKSEFDTEEKSERKISEAVKSVIKKAAFANSAEKFKSVAEFRNALMNAGFTISDNKTKGLMLEKSNDIRKSAEIPPDKIAVKKSKDEFFTVGAAKFYRRKNIFSKKEIKLKPIQPDKPDGALPKLPSEKSGQKSYKYKIAGATIFAVLVLHIVWQFSFVQSENVRDAENVLKMTQPDAVPTKSETKVPTVEPKAINQPDKIKADFKAENSEIEKSKKNVQKANYGRSETKSEPPVTKKKAVRESEAERMRRAEKLLTGM